MAGEAQVGPYITNLKIEAEQQSRRGRNIALGIEGAITLGQTMFALKEYNDRKDKENFDTLMTVGTLYGWDRMPQSDVNKFANALKSKGVDVPRDDQGNAIPPPNSTETEKARLFASLTPDQKARALYPKAYPDPNKMTVQQQMDFKKEELRIQGLRAAADMARSTRPRDFELSSGMKLDENGWPVKALPGEATITRGELKSRETALNFEFKRSLDAMKTRQIQQMLTQAPVAVQNMTRSMLNSKYSNVRQAGWDQLRQMGMAADVPFDVGDMPPEKGWQGFVDSLFDQVSPASQTRAIREPAKQSVELLRNKLRQARAANDYGLATQIEQQIQEIEHPDTSTSVPTAPRIIGPPVKVPE